ncbi:neprilysin-2-like [Musca vetustissima]|uniref:neprilysin-2-like n=1 Tax=Musca vetustissima TaxID=27455 RepID=UPI002AB6278D|nr:neprilysin-2-like [Musca vetustissima]
MKNKDSEVEEEKQTALEKAAVYLHSCLKIKTAEVVKYLNEIVPGEGLQWPLLNESDRGNWSNFKPFELLGKLHSYGFTSEILEQTTVWRNGSIWTVITIPDPSEFDERGVEKILQDLKLPADVGRHQLQELRSTHDYWQAAYADYADFGESENLFSHQDIQQSNPELWGFLEIILPEKLRDTDALVVLPFWDYIEFLSNRQWNNAKENQKFCNYLMVRFLLHLKRTSNTICLETVQERMHLAYNYLYYQEFYLPQGREISKDIADLNKIIYKSFVRLVQENRLNMSGEQLQAIRKMLANITLNIGNLPEGITLNEVEKFYDILPNLDMGNFYANDLMVMRHRNLEPIICPTTMDCGQKLATSPRYLPEQDLLVIPFASLHSPIYERHIDPLFTISSLGFLLAHELSHSIDSLGLIADDTFGHLFENIMEQQEIKESINCIKQQQHSTVEISETLADLVAVRIAYRSYIREYNRQPQFTSTTTTNPIPWRQLFFLNLGQMLCSQPLSRNVGQRLNQIAMNSPAFSKAFQCSDDSRMNAKQKCRFF